MMDQPHTPISTPVPPRIRSGGSNRHAGRSAATMSVDDAAAVILTLSAGTTSDSDLMALSGQLRTSVPAGLLIRALDEAAWRIARLVDLCVASQPDR